MSGQWFSVPGDRSVPPGALVVHDCPVSGAIWGIDGSCQCGSPWVPDQKPRDGHAQLECATCGTTVGLCPRADTEEFIGELRTTLMSRP